ncbi:unknown [Clostridium sp. CAG:448]|nr:unknown [Clostridium sp. CAG:448]
MSPRCYDTLDQRLVQRFAGLVEDHNITAFRCIEHVGNQQHLSVFQRLIHGITVDATQSCGKGEEQNHGTDGERKDLQIVENGTDNAGFLLLRLLQNRENRFGRHLRIFFTIVVFFVRCIRHFGFPVGCSRCTGLYIRFGGFFPGGLIPVFFQIVHIYSPFTIRFISSKPSGR